MNVSFDFDGTLSTEEIQALCEKFKNSGAEIFVTTARSNKFYDGRKANNKDLFEITDKLEIKRKNILFTAFADKFKTLEKHKIDLHFDDDFQEIFLINEFPGKCLGFLYEQKQQQINW